MNTSSSESDRLKVDPTRLAIAWDWVLRLRDESISQEDLTQWLIWYEADERNKDTFEEVRSFWQQADRVTEEPNPLPQALWLGEFAPAGDAPLTRHKTSLRWRAFAHRRGRRAIWAAASVAAVVALLAAVSMRPTQTGTPNEVAVAVAPQSAAEGPLVKETRLPDGSRVDLAANSSVTVQFTDRERLLTMQDGVAYFTVARNRDRPFVVKVGNLYVRAVGTAFNIRRARDRVVVTVTEGTVDVYPESKHQADPNSEAQGAADRPAGSIRVEAGREIIWAEQAAGPTIASVDPSRALAWRQGRLDYFNEPLASAIADINRYSRRQIIIRDEVVGRIVFSGTVLTSETDDWIKALPSIFPIQVLVDSQGNLILASRPS